MDALRKEFDTIDLAAIKRYVADGRDEDLHLDFKLISNTTKLKPADREHVAITVSGYANSAGGIVVWGIETERGPDDIDRAAKLRPMENLASVLAQLKSATSRAVSPILDGVEHRLIETGVDTGFVVTFVPASHGGPHMAGHGEYRYYKRSGSEFRKMEHFDVEDMFGRRPKPKLSLLARVTIYSVEAGKPTYCCGVILGIRNDGRGMAMFPCLAILRVSKPGISRFGLDGNGNTGLPRRRTCGRQSVYAGGADHVIHADSELEVTASDSIYISQLSDARSFDVTYRIEAQAVSPVEGTHAVTPDEFRTAILESEQYNKYPIA